MTLSVLILSYNHANYIGEAIESVIKQLNYIEEIELIILDDGSIDGTQEIIKSYSVPIKIKTKYFFNNHMGVKNISCNLNRMISESTQKYISFLAADDKYAEDAFCEQITYLNKNKKCALVYGNGTNFRDDNNLNPVHDDHTIQALETLSSHYMEAYVTSTIPNLYIQSILVRRNFFLNFKPFDDEMISDDWVFNIRSFRRMIDIDSSFYFINKTVFYRRLLKSSTSNNVPVHYYRNLQVAMRYIPETKFAFYESFYFKQLKTFVKNGFIGPAFKIFLRLVLVKVKAKGHSKQLEKIISSPFV
jgi:glycosyltransferase involved in cell wall biosynthesis